jgi:hypothetical protein
MSSPAPPSPRRNRLYLSRFKARSKYGPRRLLGSSISFGVKYVVVAVSSSERQATSCETICGCSVRIAHPARSTAIPPALRRRHRPARSSGTSLPPSPLSTNQFTTVATSAEASEAESTFCIATPDNLRLAGDHTTGASRRARRRPSRITNPRRRRSGYRVEKCQIRTLSTLGGAFRRRCQPVCS